VKLRGRVGEPGQSRRCTLSSRTRGDTPDSHGPLQRLLDVRAAPYYAEGPAGAEPSLA
jgi:hypothetical protein